MSFDPGTSDNMRDFDKRHSQAFVRLGLYLHTGECALSGGHTHIEVSKTTNSVYLVDEKGNRIEFKPD